MVGIDGLEARGPLSLPRRSLGVGRGCSHGPGIPQPRGSSGRHRLHGDGLGEGHTLRPIFVTEGGAELPVTNIAVALAVLLSGPGKYSLDQVLGVRLPAWLAPLGLVAIALTVVYARGQEEPQPEEEEARERLAGEEGA